MTKEIEIAPMLDLTDKHFRFFLRQICRHATLYTEMISEQALYHGDCKKLLAYPRVEQPLVLQVGGSHPDMMAQAAHLAEDYGYAAININAGCPSERVRMGDFGACLIPFPEKIADCVAQMKARTHLDITVKTRLALDSAEDIEQALHRFVDILSQAGVNKFIIHARVARLSMSPLQNRTKLPLHYDYVYRLKQVFPQLRIFINGNITSVEQIQEHLRHTDGVMIGRWAYTQPFALKDIDSVFYQDSHPCPSREDVASVMLDYIAQNADISPSCIMRHMMGLYFGTPCAKRWRAALTTQDPAAIKAFLVQLDA